MIEWRSVLRLISKIVFSIALTYIYYVIAEKIKPGHGIIGVVISIGFWGRLYSREIIEFVLLFKYWGEKSALQQWHGKYYTFDGRQIRFYLVDEVVWVALRDLKKVLDPKLAQWEIDTLGNDYGKIDQSREMAVTEAGLMRLLESRTDDRRAKYPMIRFKRWLLNEALPNVKRMPRSAVNHPIKGL